MLRQRTLQLAIAFIAFLTFSMAGVSGSWGQGILLTEIDDRSLPLPRPMVEPNRRQESYTIKDLAFHATIKDQVAETQVTQTFLNPSTRVLDAKFVFPLPDEAAIQDLTLLVNGKEYQGKMLPKDKARDIYESYVRRSQDPALLEWLGAGLYQTRVFPIPAGETRTVTIKYSQVLKKYHRLTDYLIPLATAKYTTRPIEELNIQIRLESSEKLKTIYSPTFPLDVTRAGKRTATIKVHQKQCLPASDFRLLFDTSDQAIGASLLTHWPKDDDEGYFMLLASPEVKQNRQDALPKDIIFVVDRSGSMTGKKIDQVKDSLRFVVNQLSQGDRFDIVSYSTDIEIFKPRLQAFNEETRQQALGYIEGLYAGGSTNISGALEAAFDLLQQSDRPQYVVFLTDGLPTAGVTQEAKIVEQTRETNQSRARLLSLGVGYDVNSRLLDRLTRANRGQSEYVRPDENIESYIGRLYGRIASPVLTDVSIEFLKTADRLITANLVNRLYPRELPDLFQGEQLVVAGRYTQAGAVTVRIEGKVNTEAASFEFPLNLQEPSVAQNHQFVERIWASRRIGEIIDEMDLNGPNRELIEELVMLSTRHGILTPYTSFLADDQADQGIAISDQLEQAERRVERLAEVDGISGVAQRQSKADFQRAGAPARTPLYEGRAASDDTADAPLANLSSAAFGGAVYRDIDRDRTVVTSEVVTVGGFTLYKRGNFWLANNVGKIDLDQLPPDTLRIQRFSDAYFDLAAKNTKEENAVLSRIATKTKLVIKLRNQLVLIE